MKFTPYDSPTVIAPTSGMSHFEQSSVIKTAPPGRSAHFSSPKQHEGLDLAPLSESGLQDLGKMQPAMEHCYNNGYGRFYNEYAPPALISAAAASQYYPMPSAMFSSGASTAATGAILQQHDWGAIDQYTAYQQQRASGQNGSNASNGTASAIHYSTHSASNGNDHSNGGNSTHDHQRAVYKMGAELLSPVDSGLGTDLSILEPTMIKQEFFAVNAVNSQSNTVQSVSVLQNQSMGDLALDRRDNSSSHREHSPVIIPKLQNVLGFQYTLEAPISTSIRKEDDRMTYVNKGQFYTISMEYVLDPGKMLKNTTVRSVVMVVFRDDKSYDEEIKTWQLWHKRQHSPKQRILEVDPKNSQGIIGNVEEISFNAVQFCWNTTDIAQISIAVQCLSTDFSTQKGVKGLPLHVQVDTYDDEGASIPAKAPFHRGYCQIKVFCDKGAERKLRDEEKRANRRRTAGGGGGGRKKSDGEYHESCERSEFYHMSDLEKHAPLFIPTEEFDVRYYDPAALAFPDPSLELMEPAIKRPRPSERIMLYVRKHEESIYTPLHLVPPSLSGLYRALAEKYDVDENKITQVYKQCLKGVTVKVDDDMLRHYSNQDTFVMEIEPLMNDRSYCVVKLIEILTTNNSSPSDCGRPSQQSTPLSQHQWSQQTSSIGQILNTQSHTPQ